MLELIKTDLAKAINQIIVTSELDAKFDELTSRHLNAVSSAPFTTKETQTAQKVALKILFLTKK